MIKDLRNTFKQSLVYGMSNILVKLAGLIILPIYTSTLSTDEYGMLVMLEIFSQFFVGVMAFGLPTAVLRLGSDQNDERAQNKIHFTALVMLLGILACFLAVFLPLGGVFARVVLDNGEYAVYFRLLFVSVAFEILGILPLQVMRLKEQSSRYVTYFSIKLVALVTLVWYFVAYREMGIYGAMIGIVTANGLLLVATSVYVFRNIHPVFDRSAAVAMYRYGAPLILTTIAGIALTIADRIFIKFFGELSDVGIYGLAYKVGSLANMLIIGTFALAFLPIAFRKFGDPGFDRFFSRMFTYFIGITAFLTLVVSLFSQELIKVISSDNPDYWRAVILVPFIAFSFLFKAMYNYLAYMFMLLKRTKYHAYVTVVGVTVNIALNFALIPIFDVYGVIAASALSFLIMTAFTYRVAQRKYYIPYELKRVGFLILLVAAFIAVGMTANQLPIATRLGAKILLLPAFLAVLYFGFVDEVERTKLNKARKLIREKGWIRGLTEMISG